MNDNRHREWLNHNAPNELLCFSVNASLWTCSHAWDVTPLPAGFHLLAPLFQNGWILGKDSNLNEKCVVYNTQKLSNTHVMIKSQTVGPKWHCNSQRHLFTNHSTNLSWMICHQFLLVSYCWHRFYSWKVDVLMHNRITSLLFYCGDRLEEGNSLW